MVAVGLSAPLGAQPGPPASAPCSVRACAEPPAGQAPANPACCVSVWVDLDLPELASVPQHRVAERRALRIQIQRQQETVMAGLRGLGAIEQASVQLVRNALAVRLPRTSLDAARALPGVRAVRAVRHAQQHPQVQGTERFRP